MIDWEKCNKPHRLTLEYGEVSGAELFKNGKPAKSFWAIRGFFKKQDEEVLNLLHSYIASSGGEHEQSLRALFENARAWNRRKRIVEVKESSVTNYMKLLEDW